MYFRTQSMEIKKVIRFWFNMDSLLVLATMIYLNVLLSQETD